MERVWPPSGCSASLVKWNNQAVLWLEDDVSTPGDFAWHHDALNGKQEQFPFQWAKHNFSKVGDFAKSLKQLKTVETAKST